MRVAENLLLAVDDILKFCGSVGVILAGLSLYGTYGAVVGILSGLGMFVATSASRVLRAVAGGLLLGLLVKSGFPAWILAGCLSVGSFGAFLSRHGASSRSSELLWIGRILMVSAFLLFELNNFLLIPVR